MDKKPKAVVCEMEKIGRIYMKLFKERRAVGALLLVFAFAVLFCALWLFIGGRLQSGAVALLLLFILLLIPPIERWLHLRIPTLGYALLLFLILGSLLGSCYNFYFRIPFWDILLHGLSGFLFAFIGYAICKLLFPKSENSTILPYLLVGIMFSLSVGVLWELFEAGATALLAVDMQEDSLVHEIKSFYLSGTHGYAIQIDDITKTVIHYGGGRTLTLDGYLDLGLSDTLSDMAICLLGNLLFLLLFPLDRLLGGKILCRLLPQRSDTV